MRTIVTSAIELSSDLPLLAPSGHDVSWRDQGEGAVRSRWRRCQLPERSTPIPAWCVRRRACYRRVAYVNVRRHAGEHQVIAPLSSHRRAQAPSTGYVEMDGFGTFSRVRQHAI